MHFGGIQREAAEEVEVEEDEGLLIEERDQISQNEIRATLDEHVVNHGSGEPQQIEWLLRSECFNKLTGHSVFYYIPHRIEG